MTELLDLVLIRCVDALVIYCQAGREEEPYVTISRKIFLKNGRGTLTEWETGHSERKLAVHRNAFKRTVLIQAFLGSTPQLTLQLYVTIQEKEMIPSRGRGHWCSGSFCYCSLSSMLFIVMFTCLDLCFGEWRGGRRCSDGVWGA